jgi:hypothetical protein
VVVGNQFPEQHLNGPITGPFLLQLPWLLNHDPELPLINAGFWRFLIALLPRHYRNGWRLQCFAYPFRLAEQPLKLSTVVHQVFAPETLRKQNLDFLGIRPASLREEREKGLFFLSFRTSLQRRAFDRMIQAGRWHSLRSANSKNPKNDLGHSVRSIAAQESTKEWLELTF